MPLRSQFYLSDATRNAATADERRRIRSGWLKPLWVLPRAWCVTASLHAKGVPRHKTAALVRLHLSRLTSFVDSGVYACRVGDWVHLWFWENQRVRDFCLAHDLDFAGIRLAPESVCFPRIRDGAVIYRGIEGVEAQLWHNGLLLDSAWWPEMIDAATWQAWRPTSAASSVGSAMPAAWPEALPAISPLSEHLGLSAPWASNLLGEKWWHNFKRIRVGILYAGLAGLLLGLAGFWGAQWLTLQQMQSSAEKEIASLSAQVEPVSAARERALEYLQWSNQISRLSSQIDVNDTIKMLQPVLQLQEAALREFEYADGEMRLVLVPINTELNIAALTQQLESLPMFANIRLLPDSDVRVLHVSAKIRLPLNAEDNGAVPDPLLSPARQSHASPGTTTGMDSGANR